MHTRQKNRKGDLKMPTVRKLTISACAFLIVSLLSGVGYAGPADKTIPENKATREFKAGAISGQIMIRSGVPMAGGMVYFFNDTAGPPPSISKYWRVPSESASIDSNGRFSAELDEGYYYMGAIKRISGGPLGPPQDGDYYFLSQDEKGKPKLHSVKKGETTDIGIVSEVRPFRNSMLAKRGVTAIEGTVLDAKSRPLEGVMVYAFVTNTLVGRPLFVSDRTGKDGRYLLRVAGGGTYFLRVRNNYGGGAPAKGDIIGAYGEGGPEGVDVKTGEVRKGIDIMAMVFPGRGPRKEEALTLK